MVNKTEKWTQNKFSLRQNSPEKFSGLAFDGRQIRTKRELTSNVGMRQRMKGSKNCNWDGDTNGCKNHFIYRLGHWVIDTSCMAWQNMRFDHRSNKLKRIITRSFATLRTFCICICVQLRRQTCKSLQRLTIYELKQFFHENWIRSPQMQAESHHQRQWPCRTKSFSIHVTPSNRHFTLSPRFECYVRM